MGWPWPSKLRNRRGQLPASIGGIIRGLEMKKDHDGRHDVRG